jgi:methyl-accepting chemotaxis protein
MNEVVASIRRVNDIMGEISSASSEQSAGVSQVGEAITQMDQTTQQNAALVEEMAAAASSLKMQANDLVQTVAVFKLSGNTGQSGARDTVTPLSAPAHPAGAAAKQVDARLAPPASMPAEAASPAKRLAAAEGDWETF